LRNIPSTAAWSARAVRGLISKEPFLLAIARRMSRIPISSWELDIWRLPDP